MKKKNTEIMKKDQNTKKIVWTRKSKIAAILTGVAVLAIVAYLILTLVFDLGPLREIERTEQEGKVVGECADYDVYYDELRYVTLLYRAKLDKKYGKYDTLADEMKAKYEEELEAIVCEELKSNYVILALCDKYDVDTNSSEARAYVNESLEDLVDEIGSRDKYKEWLEENALSDALVRFMYKMSYLESALLEQLTVSGEVVEFTPANIDNFVTFVMEEDVYAKVIHVYYPREHFLYDDRNSSMTEEVNAAMEALKSATTDSKRYDVMCSLIGNAPFVNGYSVEGIGSYITYGQMHEDYENAAFALDDYGVSEIVELEEGCYIIMRMPKIRDEVARHAYDLVEYYRYAVLKQLKDAENDEIKFEGNSYFDSIKLIDIK